MNKDIGTDLKSFFCGASYAVAGGAGDNTAVTGATIDTQGFESGKVVVAYTTTLTDAKTYDLAVAYQTSDTGSTWNTAVDLRADAVVVTSDGGGTETGTLEFDVPLSDKPRYIRINFTPDLSHTGTDTAITSTTLIAGGSYSNPVTKA